MNGRCKFEPPYGDGETCLRETVRYKHLHFINRIYPLIVRGEYWAKGNYWAQDNLLIETVEFITQKIKDIQSG